MNATPSPQPLTVSALIADIIWLLCQTIAERVRIGVVTPAGVEYIVKRLLGIRRRFRTLAARIEAGKIPRERMRAPRKRRDPEVVQLESELPRGWRRMRDKFAERKPQPLWRALGQRNGWLLRLAPQIFNFANSAAFCRARLETALDDPEMQALLRTSRKVGDTLRPLCWMLAIDFSRLYPARPAAAVAEDGLATAAFDATNPLGDSGCQNPVAAPPCGAFADPAPVAEPDSPSPPDFSRPA